VSPRVADQAGRSFRFGPIVESGVNLGFESFQSPISLLARNTIHEYYLLLHRPMLCEAMKIVAWG
jgi:hypothetical protein